MRKTAYHVWRLNLFGCVYFLGLHTHTHTHITLSEEKVLYRTLKGSISAMYLEPLKGSIHS